MTSLLTNTSAMTALQTLKSINASLDQTTARVSTGQRVSSAADNAAYWSIATTVRADNSSLGAVKDVLGLGAATVDTAYTGMNNIIDNMKEMRAKLTASLAPNVDRAKVQVEIEALQARMRATSDSSVMSGQNWLSVDSSDTAYKATQEIVAGFSRASDGTINFSTVDVAVDNIALYDAAANAVPATTAKVTAGTAMPSTIDFSGAQDVTFTLAVDGGTAATITLDNASLVSAAVDISAVTRDELLAAINNQLNADTNTAGLVSAAFDSSGRLTFETVGTGSTSTLDIDFTVMSDDIGFGAAPVTLSQATGTDASGTAGVGILDTLDSGTGVSIDTLDISGALIDDDDIKAFINQVDSALASMTDAATTLGASKTQLAGQTSFVDSLMKANERTIGTLVDADMEEESTKLKALQTQQQLAIQSLGIANSSSQNILTLFR